MTSTTNQAPRATNFVNLSFFRIYVRSTQESSPQVSVFRNSRQQCRIQIAFIAVDSQNRKVELTDSEIQDAVRLIKYVGGTQIEYSDWFGDTSLEWQSTFRDFGFSWEPSSMAAAQALQDDVDKVLAENLDIDELTAYRGDKSSRLPSLTSTSPEHHWDKEFFRDMVAECRRQASAPVNESLPTSGPEPDVVPNAHPLLGRTLDGELEGLQEGAQLVTFLLSTRSTSPLAVGASIRSSTGQTFRTNHSHVHDPAGHGNGRGEFNSQVIVNTVAIPHYGISAYGDFLPVVDNDWVLRDHRVYGGGTSLRAYEHHIRLTVDGKWIRFITIDGPVNDTSIWNDAGDVGAEWSYSYMGLPGQTTLYHADYEIGYFSSGNNHNDIRYDSRQLMRIVAPSGIHRSRPGEFIIGQVMSDEHLQISNWKRHGYARRSKLLVLLDEHGNYHRVLTYLPDGRYKFNYIAIAKG